MSLSVLGNSIGSSAARLPVISSTQSLNQAVGLPLDLAKRSLAMTGSLNYKIDTVGIGQATLAKAITTAAQSGKIDFNVSPAVFDARTGSKAGSEVESYAKGLNIKTDKRSVKQLIAAIGDKTAGSAGNSVALPGKILKSLGGVALAALVSTDDPKLIDLGVKLSTNFEGGQLRFVVKGNEKTGPNSEFAGTVFTGNSSLKATVDARFNTQGRSAVKVSLQANGNGSKAEINAALSSIQGEPSFKADATFGLSLGAALLQGNVAYSNAKGALGAEAGLSINSGACKVGVDFNSKEVKASVSCSESY